ncbi:dTDP-4-dehydrorhamnose reductase [Aureliella helgolandensis]|uniref:dTDP-4-dehydrorhamnose reductase n=1 Tax=Aureliella helgolandensis TaxID=2527968 RepID=A0A518G596_9BACT|nr:dTDP-4-dehydrorhamnose reductase [Aureliella helgolandensis]QDV23767.1 dTDP-4-dehydrorhamnose reductase [Aureliella helgolandensis]
MIHTLPTRISGVEILRSQATGTSSKEASAWFSAISQQFGGPRRERVVCTRAGQLTAPSYYRLGGTDRTLRCLSGEMVVVVIDTRHDSPTFAQWHSFLLSSDNARGLWIPAGVAVGWQTVSPRAQLAFSQRLCQGRSQQGWLRWDDPQLAIGWPSIPQDLLEQPATALDLEEIANPDLPCLAQVRRTKVPQAKCSVWYPAAAIRRTLHRQEKTRTQIQFAKVQVDASRTPLQLPNELSNAPGVVGARQPGAAAGITSRATSAMEPTTAKDVILVIGSSGQLGHDLCRYLRQLGTVVGACRDPEKHGLLPVPTFVDISRPASIRTAIRKVRPKLIVNATGLTNVDRAEKDPRIAQLVNAAAPAIMAEEAREVGAGMIHFCTDMVFDGSGERPWNERDRPNPLNQYGRTKLLGTEAIRASGVPHLILRTGWLYSTHGENYVKSIVDLCTYRSSITLASDHFGSPTSTDWLARTLTELLSSGTNDLVGWLAQFGGLYHLSNLGFASRVEVGDQIIATCKQLTLPVVLQKFHSAKQAELPTPTPCPLNCRLDSSAIAVKFGMTLPRWQAELNLQIAKLLDSSILPAQSVA